MRLKKVCERFISETSSLLTAPLKSLLARVQVILQLASKDKLDPKTLLHQQPFASAGTTYMCHYVRTQALHVPLNSSFAILSHNSCG